MSASAAYRLDSVHRAEQGFTQYASQPNHEPPIYIYDRLEEPTRGLLEENLAYAEGGQIAVCFATGMAAINAGILTTTQAGENIVAHHTLYGCTYSLLTNWLPRFGISTTFTDLRDLNSFAQAITDLTRVIYLETPVNPTLHLIDIAELRRLVDIVNAERQSQDKIVIIVDNTFATPYCQRPLALGADLLVHSLTKNIGGFGTDIGWCRNRTSTISRAAARVS